MLRLSLKNISAHKRRLAGTFLAIVIGVAFFSGVNTLSATITDTFNGFFSNGNRATSAYVRSTTKLEATFGPGTSTQRGRIPLSMADAVRAVPGVVKVQPVVQGFGRIVTSSGEALGNEGPPMFAEGWIDDPGLSSLRIAEGRAPQAEGEVVIDRGSAKQGKVHVGDRVTVTLAKPVTATVVGIATYGDEDSAGGATDAAFWEPQALRDIPNQAGMVDGFKVVAADGVSQDEIVARIAPVLPAGTEAITGRALVKDLQDSIQRAFLAFFNIFLGIFAVIAVVVAVFSIYNTFSILVAQRTREMALLRALGASRGQVLRSVIGESLIVGLTASFIGVFFGLLVASGLKAFMRAVGFNMPAGSLVFGAGTVVTGVLVGTVVALIAGLGPAVKATRIPPLAAMRDVAVEKVRASRVRVVIGVLLVGGGLLAVIGAVVGQGDDASAQAGLGAFMTFVGTIVLGPAVSGPISRLLGFPLPRILGVTGALARDNASRNPRRTSGAAAALMIGVGIVSLFTVFAASIKATVDHQVDKSFAGDLVVSAGNNFGGSGVPPGVRDAISIKDDVEIATGLRFGLMEIAGSGKGVFVADPNRLTEVLDVGVSAGSLTDLGLDGIAVAEDVAHDHGWSLGQTLPARFVDGSAADLTIRALYRDSDVVGGYLLPLETWRPHSLDDFDMMVVIKARDGVSPTALKQELEPLVKAQAGGSKLQTREEFRDAQSGQVDQLIVFVYAMLGVAIVISLMGIANTLSLSMNERVHELGLLRAVGMLREQLKQVIRWESVLIASFGTIGGLGLGLFFAWALVESASGQGLRLALPVPALVIVVVLGALAGIVAAAGPARRAARIDLLAAIATE